MTGPATCIAVNAADVDALFEAYEATRARDLRNQIVEHFGTLSATVARRFAGRGEPLEDLVQVAHFALVKAVERYEPGRGVPFVGFAVPAMLGEIKRHFRDRTWSGRVPRSAKEMLAQVNVAIDTLSSSLERSPDLTEIAAHLGVSVDAVIEALDARSLYRPSSLSTLATARDEHPGLATADVGLHRVDNELTVRHLLDQLPERERRIVELRYFEDQTQSEIAARFGVSQMHVSRLLRTAIAMMAEAANPEPLP